MRRLFLGHYLLKQGLVTQGQLDQAVALQMEANRRLGDLAEEAGLLTPDQVRSILAAQRAADLNFGELAVAEGFVTRADMDDLLFRQHVHQVHLGEALLTQRALTMEQFSLVLEEYSRQEEARRKELDAVLGPRGEGRAVRRLVEALERAFPRFVGCPLKALGALGRDELAGMRYSYDSLAPLKEGGVLRYSLHLGERMQAVVAEAPGAARMVCAGPEGAVRSVLATICAHVGLVLSGAAPGADRAGEARGDVLLRLGCPEAEMGLCASPEGR
ncbi:hypothetical protein [Fundidesulfovibrio agrisoli]|uniref:hypothetical protein n=1 Tax=Fundidesulfovibrio agrisoli TaxID=2922717 RepID=UPI001FABFEAC|nr:hypothetical protein [Fundidesulfovibrio agrisoli]